MLRFLIWRTLRLLAAAINGIRQGSTLLYHFNPHKVTTHKN
jgi:hypothetical protein